MTRESSWRSDVKPSYDTLGAVDRVGYDPQTETYHAQHDWADDTALSLTVVETLAAVTGTELTAMKPLHSVVDPDVLDALLAADGATDIEVEFTYKSWSVTTTGNGDIVIQERE